MFLLCFVGLKLPKFKKITRIEGPYFIFGLMCVIYDRLVMFKSVAKGSSEHEKGKEKIKNISMKKSVR